MAARQFVGQFNSGANPITASGVSPALQNNTGLNSIDIVIEIEAAPTGTSPTLVVQLQASLDGSIFQNVGAATSALSAAGTTVLTVNSVDAPFLQLSYTVGGTTPSFGSTKINAYAF